MVLICSDAVLLDPVELEAHVYETPTVDKMPSLPTLGSPKFALCS